MIASFGDRATADLYHGRSTRRTRRFPPDVTRTALRKLDVLNGAKVGNNCLIGAGALVSEGKEIPDNSLVMGMPGKVVRDVSDEQIAIIKRGVAGYAAKWKRFQSGLTEI